LGGKKLKTAMAAGVTVASLAEGDGMGALQAGAEGLTEIFVKGSKKAAKNAPGKSLLPGEGAVGTYDDLIAAGRKGDKLTPHHIPSANHMAGQEVSHGKGVSIMIEQPVPGVGGRHRSTFTYGTTADIGMTSRDALAAGIREARRIYMQDGLYSPHIRGQLQDVIRQNKVLYPTVFAK
jgi:hypothetical protein